MQVWDTAGAEAYRSINALYYKKAAIVFLVYSVTEYESFAALSEWAKEIDNQADVNVRKFVVGTKIDDTEVEEGEGVSK